MIDWNSMISGAISGSIFGSLASLIAPWVNWRIEKHRLKLESRRKLISEWRLTVANSENLESFRESSGYAGMRPYLLRNIINQIESDTIVIQNGGRDGGVNNFKPCLYDDIVRIEKYWELV